MDRRQFCRNLLALGGSAALAPLLAACERAGTAEPPPSTPTSTATAPPLPTAPATPAPTISRQPTAPARPTPTTAPTATATPDPSLEAVALVATTDRAAGVRRALELLGVNPVHGANVLLKPNINSAVAAPGSTHPVVLETLLASLRDLGARQIAR